MTRAGGHSLGRAALAVAVLGMALTGLATPAVAAKTYQLKACVNTKTAAVRVVTKSVKCKAVERYVGLYTVTAKPPTGVRYGTGAPNSEVGYDGDFYVDTAGLIFYGPRMAGAWGLGQSLRGTTGPAGPTGAQGATGPTGPAGSSGSTGATGADGRTILSGSTAPASSAGANGDYYIDTATITLYGPKASGAWPSGVSLVGPSGGRTILNGSVDPTSQGADGDFYLNTANSKIFGPKASGTWPAGVSLIGATGAKGETGTAGTQGVQGIQGIQGAKGETGTVADLHYGSYYDTDTVALAAQTAVAVPLNSTLVERGISVAFNQDATPTRTRITFSKAGVYNIAFSTQLLNTANASRTVSVWLATGVSRNPIAWSNTDVFIGTSNTEERKVIAWNFFVNATTSQFIELMISSSAANVSILSSQAQSNPTRPEIPGTILTVNQVG